MRVTPVVVRLALLPSLVYGLRPNPRQEVNAIPHQLDTRRSTVAGCRACRVHIDKEAIRASGPPGRDKVCPGRARAPERHGTVRESNGDPHHRRALRRLVFPIPALNLRKRIPVPCAWPAWPTQDARKARSWTDATKGASGVPRMPRGSGLSTDTHTQGCISDSWSTEQKALRVPVSGTCWTPATLRKTTLRWGLRTTAGLR
jgi:hypothetical protein